MITANGGLGQMGVKHPSPYWPGWGFVTLDPVESRHHSPGKWCGPVQDSRGDSEGQRGGQLAQFPHGGRRDSGLADDPVGRQGTSLASGLQSPEAHPTETTTR